MCYKGHLCQLGNWVSHCSALISLCSLNAAGLYKDGRFALLLVGSTEWPYGLWSQGTKFALFIGSFPCTPKANSASVLNGISLG